MFDKYSEHQSGSDERYSANPSRFLYLLQQKVKDFTASTEIETDNHAKFDVPLQWKALPCIQQYEY